MTVVSNIYAEKIFAEHPIDLWVLDEPADYVSLISEAQRDFQTADDWVIENATTGSNDLEVDSPFNDSYTTKIIGDSLESSLYSISLTSPELSDMSSLNQSIGTVTISAYIYSQIIDVALESISLGIEYILPGEEDPTIIEKEIDFVNLPQWRLVAETFDIVNESVPFKIFIKANVNNTGSTGEYNFYINGLTVGQWSSEFNATSLGVVSENLPSSISVFPENTKAYTAQAYGPSSDNGYYIINNNYLSAKNTSIPLVFGASNLTVLSPNKIASITYPSLIVPGKGFLNKRGKNLEYTVEFWMRVSSDAIIPKRIFGPISTESNDGLYVEDGFLTLSIGGTSQSYFVNEWYRPMLISIRLIRNSVSMLVNGEEVINFAINTDSLDLPDILDENGKQQDWLGFYSYDDVSPLEISCVSIYSYQVPTSVIKRRFVYGQGVGSPENINGTFGGTTAFVDYAFANYAVNYNYPDFARWDQGSFDNLVVSNKFLSTPEYELPEIVIPGKTLNQLYTDNSAEGVQNEDYKFITFRPNSSWNSVSGYFNFPKFNILNEEIHTFYGVFKPLSNFIDNEVLIKFSNKITGNSLTIVVDKHDINNDGIEENVIAYYLVYNGESQDDFIMYEYTPGERVAIGLDIQKFSEFYGGNVSAFFGNTNGLEVYIGGDPLQPTQTFRGKIYDVGFCSTKNASKVSNHFNENGIAKVEDADELIDHLASYTLLVGENYGVYNLDIGVAGYWQDYLPLSYFAKYVSNSNGRKYYDLDFLQFNIGYPAVSSLTETITALGWTYEDLYDEYSGPPVKTYVQLDNIAFTGYDDYSELAGNAQSEFDYNTENAAVRSYVTFQYIQDGANLNDEYFTTTLNAEQSKLIDISEYSNWTKTKFEIVNDSIIYPRKDVDFNDLAIVYTLEFNVRGTIGKRVTIDRLQLASQVLNQNSFNPIGTRFGVNMYPYTKAGIYYDYKGKNPFSIYKGSTPYLYLTRTSGIQIRGDVGENRGVAIPINEQLSIDYEINAFQIWMRYDNLSFPDQVTKLFEIEYKDDTISFYMEPSDLLNRRARIFALNENGSQQFLDVAYYINGRQVAIPTINSREWTSLGIFFLNSLDLSLSVGKVNLVGPMLFNNISFYKTNNLANVQNLITRSWQKVINDSTGTTPDGWEYWTSAGNPGVIGWGTWFNVLAIDTYETTDFDPGTIYKAYIGTNKIVFDDNEGIELETDSVKAYSDIKWLRRTESAV